MHAEISQQRPPHVGDGHELRELVIGHPCPWGPFLASQPKGTASLEHELARFAPFQCPAVTTGGPEPAFCVVASPTSPMA